MILVQDCFVVFTNDVAAKVSFNLVAGFRFSGLRIIDRNSFLRGPSLAAGVDARGFHWSKDTAGRTAGTASYQPHDRAQPRGGLGRHHLFEHLWRSIELD